MTTYLDKSAISGTSDFTELTRRALVSLVAYTYIRVLTAARNIYRRAALEIAIIAHTLQNKLRELLGKDEREEERKGADKSRKKKIGPTRDKFRRIKPRMLANEPFLSRARG